jgi:hypothetical protein
MKHSTQNPEQALIHNANQKLVLHKYKMDLKKFDSTLKSALDNIEEPFDPSTWAALESRLNALPAPDALDKALRPSLERIETAYDSSSWSALSGRMDGIARARKVRLIKLAEAAIFLLLLLNLKGFFGVVESVTNPVPVKIEFKGPIAHSQSSKNKTQSSIQGGTTKVKGSAENQSLTDQLVAFVQNITASLTTGTEITISATQQPIAASTATLLDPANFYSESGLVKFQVGSVLPSLPLVPVQYAGSAPFIPGLQIQKYRNSSHLYASTFGSFDKNYLKDSGYKNQGTGSGGGFAVGYRKGKWGIETGITYSQKKYQPKRVNQEYQNDPFNGITFFYVDNVEADVFSIPVKATRRMAKVKNTTAMAVGGVSSHFASNKRYGYNTVHYPPPGQLPDPAPGVPAIPTFPEAKGIFENGGLSYNAYATADLGLRVEQALGKRYIAFVEPIYRQSLGGGIGPKASHLSTFSVQAGVMASL